VMITKPRDWFSPEMINKPQEFEEGLPIFYVRVRLNDKSGETLMLPPPDDPEAFFNVVINAVMFRASVGEREKKLVVLYSTKKVGPQGELADQALVYRWNDRSFERMPHIEERLFGAKTAREVDRRLAKLKGKK
jgi:hypothetical protein